MNVVVRASMAAAVALSLSACHQGAMSQQAPSGTAAGALNTLTPAEVKAGWRLLFDGKTTAGWRGYRMDSMPPQWTVTDGVLSKSRTTEDILTVEMFSDFELKIDWKVALGGNSGIFYRGSETYDRVYWSAPEYQLAEDSLTPDSRNPMTAVAAVYGFYPSKRGVASKAGEWNSTRLVVKGPHVEHWLNGVMIAQYELWSPEWLLKLHGDPKDPTKRPLKFAPYKLFGLAKTGYIAIQGDHNGALSLRNIKIRELK